MLKRLLPNIVLKERQAKIMLEVLEIYKKAMVNTRSSITEKEYVNILMLVQKIRNLNSRTGGKVNLEVFNPVTTLRKKTKELSQRNKY